MLKKIKRHEINQSRVKNIYNNFQQSSICTQDGFTLIEMVAVIVLLGILAATALPRFLNINTDARKAVLESMGGAILSASNLVYSKSVIGGVQNLPTSNIDLDRDGVDDVQVIYGYPSADRNQGVAKIMGGSFSSEWTWGGNYSGTRFWLTTASLGGRSGLYVNTTSVINSGCYMTYDAATGAGSSPTISYVTTKC
ncbi:MAG: MSHA pilin protein MshA [Paraglaciecola psychrophila]